MVSPNLSDAALDGGLDFFTGTGRTAATVTRVDACDTEPTTYAEATSTYSNGNYTLTPGSDFTKANDTSGRKVTLGQKTGNNATSTGTGSFLAFTNGSNTLYCVIDADGETLNSGSPWQINATDVWNIQDPT